METKTNIAAIDELCSLEDVFTTAQAARSGISRLALSRAVAAGYLERLGHGVYRRASSLGTEHIDVQAGWKITSPGKFSHERLSEPFDGVAARGRSAACIHGIGDFLPYPAEIAVPRRFNSRREGVDYRRESLTVDDVVWRERLPVTRIGKTLLDLWCDGEDPSLVGNTLVDAVDKYGTDTLTIGELEGYLGKDLLEEMLASSDADTSMIVTDKIGHIALMKR